MSRADISEKDVFLLAPSIQIWQSGKFNYAYKAAKKLSALKREQLIEIAEKLKISTKQPKFFLAKAILQSIIEGGE